MNAIDLMTDLDFDLLGMSDSELHAFAMAASSEAGESWLEASTVAEIEQHPAFTARRAPAAAATHELPTAA